MIVQSRPRLDELYSREGGAIDTPTTSYVIPGPFTFGDMSRYDLKHMADQTMAHYYLTPAKSQIYAELRRHRRAVGARKESG
jgi:hypothetical protein